MTVRKRMLVTIIIMLCLIGSLIATIYYYKKRPFIEYRIMAECNKNVVEYGKCDIDLALLFDDFEWDAVSIFVAGNTRLLERDLGIYSEFSNGLVFSLGGTPVYMVSSTYSGYNGEPPTVLYYLD